MGLREKLEMMKAPAVQAKPVSSTDGSCEILLRSYSLDYEYGTKQLGEYLNISADTLGLMFGRDAGGLQDALFIDTETTGLSGSGSVAFLIGLGYMNGGEFVVEQLLMRDFDEEASALERLTERMARASMLVSFNGKSFDLPLLQSRYVMNRMRPQGEGMPHADLLFLSRRLWRERLDGFALKKLEVSVLGFEREGDIDGALIPGRYFRYLQTREKELLEDIIEHNRLDILAMAALLAELGGIAGAPERFLPTDARAVGRLKLTRGDLNGAISCFEDAGERGADGALTDLAFVYKKQGRIEEAAAMFREIAQSGKAGLTVWIELAKYYEHAKKDDATALKCARRAEAILRECGCPQDSPRFIAVTGRLRRLLTRLAKAEVF